MSNMTKEEEAWVSAVVSLGCIVCLITNRGYVPGALHHFLSGGRRRGHLWSICLCDPGHHKNADPRYGEISRHPGDGAAFHARYGSEEFLYEVTQQGIIIAGRNNVIHRLEA